MSRRLRLPVSAAVLMALALAGPASAQTFGSKPKDNKQKEGVVEQPQRRIAPPARAQASPPPIMSPAPYFPPLPDTTPRIGGLAAQRLGGGQCRTACSQDYYRCLSGDEMGNCGSNWSRCLAGCPSVTSSE
jgi:hypothetical protein